MSSIYIGLLWGITLGLIFAILCLSLLFYVRKSFVFELSQKKENLAITIFLIGILVRTLFLSDSDKTIFLFWRNIGIKSLFALLLALLFPIIIGYMTIRLIAVKISPNILIFENSFFVGTLTTLLLFLLMDAIRVPKNLGILFVFFIIFLVKIIKDKHEKCQKERSIHIHIPLYTLLIFVFASAMYASVYLSSFVKGDFWKQCAIASYIELNGFEKFLKTRVSESYRGQPLYSLALYFLASLADSFSIPLLNLVEALAILIPGFSTLAMLTCFLAIENGEENRAKFAVLIWLLFSGWGMLYLLLEYGTLQPSHDLALKLMNKLGWGGGLIYSPALGSFEHVLRLFSITAMVSSQTILIQQKESLRGILLGLFVSLISILFHPLMASLVFIFFWFTFLITMPKVGIRSGTVFVLSYGIILLFDYFFATKLYYNNLALLGISIVAIITTATNIARHPLRPNLNLPDNIRILFGLSLKSVLLASLVCYFYAFAVLYWNYNTISLDRFPIIPLYAWPYIMGIPGFLALALAGVIIFKNCTASSGEKYFFMFAFSVFSSSIILDYNNVYQVVKIFDPNLISFRLIPIMTIPISYLAGSLLYRISIRIKSEFDSCKYHSRNVYVQFIIIIIILGSIGSMYTFTLPRVKFWMENNWPAVNAEEYHVSEEELALIRYLRAHITGEEFVGIEDNSIKTISRFGEASPLGRIVSLSGAKVISKELGQVLFQAKSIETVNLLKETLNIKYIVIEKGYNTYNEKPSYLRDIILRSTNPVFETDNYAVYELPHLLNVSEANLIPNISHPFHYGIFSEEVRLRGKIELRTNLLQIGKLEINNSVLINIQVQAFENLTLTLFDAEGILISSPLNSKSSLNFDGIDDYVEIPNLITSKPFTVQFWAKINASQGSNLFDSRDKAFVGGGKGFSIEDIKGNGHYSVGLGDGLNFIWSNPVLDLSDHRWHNIAISVTSTRMHIYMDGILRQVVDISEINGSLANVGTIKIGTGLKGYFNGQIDNVLFYNRALTPEEVKFNILNREPLSNGLQLMFDMEDYSGTILYDKSGYENNGIIHGCSWRSNGIEIQLIKPSDMRLNGVSKLISNSREVNIETSDITGKIFLNIILPGNFEIRVEGNVTFKDTRLTWPYIEKIGQQGNITLSGTISFEILNTHDTYIPIRLNSFSGFNSYYQNVERERIIKYYQQYYGFLDLKTIFILSFSTLVYTLLIVLSDTKDLPNIFYRKGERE